VHGSTSYSGETNQVGKANAKPGHETCYGGHVGKPAKHFSRSTVDAHVCKCTEERAEDNRYEGQAGLGCLCENFRRAVRESETIWILVH
jgi:hypothetical protein